MSQAQLCYGGYEEEDAPPNLDKCWFTLVTSIWLPVTVLRHMNIPILKKEKTETLTITSPACIIGKVFNRVTKPLSASSHPLPRLDSSLSCCLPPLAFFSLPSNLSTYFSLAVESSKTSLLCWPTPIGKWLQMTRRPEVRELQLKLQSGRGQGTGHCTSVMLDSGSWCACMPDVHQYVTFLNWILANKNSWLGFSIYLFIYCSSLFCLSRWESSRKTGLCMSHNPEKALLRIQLTLFCSVAQVISISVAVLSMLLVSYYHEW